MRVIRKINELKQVKNKIRKSIEKKEANLENVELRDYDTYIFRIVDGDGASIIPSLAGGNFFTGATIPLTYYNLVNDAERVYQYKSLHKITISGLEGRAIITDNGSEHVIVKFNTSSDTSSIKDFTISLNNGIVFQGIHAHYGNYVDSTQTLVFYDLDTTLDESLGTLDVNYAFYVGDYITPFSFESPDSNWNGIYPHQVLNVKHIDVEQDNVLGFCYKFNQPINLNGKLKIGYYFLNTSVSFNQPLDLSNITEIGERFMSQCVSFNQEVNISSITNGYLGDYFLEKCSSFNKPIKWSSLFTEIPRYFLSYCYAFNQPLDMSYVTEMGSYFLYNAYAFNQPLDLSNVKTMGNYSLRGWHSYNHPINLENIETIGQFCFVDLVSLNKPFKIGNKLNSIGYSFLRCDSLTNIIWNSNVYPGGSPYRITKTKQFSLPIVVYGTYRAGLIDALPDVENDNSIYRKLVNGGS